MFDRLRHSYGTSTPNAATNRPVQTWKNPGGSLHQGGNLHPTSIGSPFYNQRGPNDRRQEGLGFTQESVVTSEAPGGGDLEIAVSPVHPSSTTARDVGEFSRGDFDETRQQVQQQPPPWMHTSTGGANGLPPAAGFTTRAQREKLREQEEDLARQRAAERPAPFQPSGLVGSLPSWEKHEERRSEVEKESSANAAVRLLSAKRQPKFETQESDLLPLSQETISNKVLRHQSATSALSSSTTPAPMPQPTPVVMPAPETAEAHSRVPSNFEDVFEARNGNDRSVSSVVGRSSAHSTASTAAQPSHVQKDRGVFSLRAVDTALTTDPNLRVGSPWRRGDVPKPPPPPQPEEGAATTTDQNEAVVVPPFPYVLTQEMGAQVGGNDSGTRSAEDGGGVTEGEAYYEAVAVGQAGLGEEGTMSQPKSHQQRAQEQNFRQRQQEQEKREQDLKEKEQRLLQWAHQLKEWADQLESREALLMQEAAAHQESHLQTAATLSQKEQRLSAQMAQQRKEKKTPKGSRQPTPQPGGSVAGSETASNAEQNGGGLMECVDDRLNDFSWGDRWSAALSSVLPLDK